MDIISGAFTFIGDAISTFWSFIVFLLINIGKVAIVIASSAVEISLLDNISKKTKANRTGIVIFGIILIILTASGLTYYMFDMNFLSFLKPAGTIEKIQKKTNELVELNAKLAQKKNEAANAKTIYLHEVNNLKSEIYSEAKKSGVANSYQRAIQNQRINSNLALISRQLAYIKKLEELEFHLNTGVEEIRYLTKEAQSDLVMAKVLEGNTELISRIGEAIKTYKPYAENFVIDKNNLTLRPPEEIWNDIMSGKI